MSAATPLESEAQRKTVSGVTRSLPPANGDAIALDEADLAVLDHADGEPDHRRIRHQPVKPLVEAQIIDRMRARRAAAADRDVEAVGGRGQRRGDAQRQRPQARRRPPVPPTKYQTKRRNRTKSKIQLLGAGPSGAGAP